MSVQSEITRLSDNVTAALAAIADKGVTVPDGSNSDSLAALIESIEAGGGGGTAYGTYTPSKDLNIYNGRIVIETGNIHASNGIIYCEDFNSLSSDYDMLFLAVVDGVAIGTKIYGKNGPVSFSTDPSVNNGGFFLGETNSACKLKASYKYVWVVW